MECKWRRVRWGRLLPAIVVTSYVYSVLNNLISYRQAQAGFNGTLTDITAAIKFPETDLIYALNAWTGVTIALSFLVWVALARSGRPLATLVATECLLLPLMSFAQWATVVPDALPQCLDIFAVPRGEDISWIWSRVFPRACGDVYWATDVAQIILWGTLAVRSVSWRSAGWARCMTVLVALNVVLGAGLAVGSRYQYSSDVVLTLVFASLAATHPAFVAVGTRAFIHPDKRAISEAETVPFVDDAQL